MDGRDGQAADVTICIPAWQSAHFIDKTLRFASGQTHLRIRILVSVDRCDDATFAICESHARADSRIRTFQQPERLGWARNVNFLLDKVDTDFFFIYFHDDIILPQYTERLLQALCDYPEAASVHCDMGHFGASDYVSVGLDYADSVAKRLLTFLLAPQRGAPLRSLTRSALLTRGLRLPTDAVGGFWANEPYLMRLLALGPAIHVPETLYLRWDQRAGGLTDGWKKTLSPEQMISAFRANVGTTLAIINESGASKSELETLVFVLYVYMMTKVRAMEIESGTSTFTRAEDLSLAFMHLRAPEALGQFGAEIRDWAMEGIEQLLSLEAAALESRCRSLGIR